MNLFDYIMRRVLDAAAAQGLAAASADRARISLVLAVDPRHGDVTTNAALVLADAAGRPPHAFAVAIAEALRTDSMVASAEVGGPGFVNLGLRPETWASNLRDLLASRARNNPFEPNGVSGFERFSKLDSEMGLGPTWVTTAFYAPGTASLTAAQINTQAYDNPLFNTRYAHARARAMYRRAGESFPVLPQPAEQRIALLQGAALERLSHPSEGALLRQIACYPHVLEVAAAHRQPHHLGAYLNGLAGTFHAQLRHGMVTPHLGFIKSDDRELTVARLALVEAVAIILGAGLLWLGFEAPDEIT